MIGYKPHRLDQDVRRLRLRFFPNHACGKVALFSRVPSDSIRFRECTAKGDGFAIMRKPTTTGMKTWIRDDYGAQTFSDNHFQGSAMAVHCQEKPARPAHWQNH